MCAGLEPLVELQMDQMASFRTCVSEEYDHGGVERLLEEDADPLGVAEDELALLGGADQDVREGPETLFLAEVVRRGAREQHEELVDDSRVDNFLGLLVGAVGHVADELEDLVGEGGAVGLQQLQEARETPALDEQPYAVVAGQVDQRREDRVEGAFFRVFLEHLDERRVHGEAQLELFFERAARGERGQRPAGVLGDLLVVRGHELLDQRVDDVGHLQALLERLVLLRNGADGPGALLEDLLFVAADDLGQRAEEAFVDEAFDAGLGASADVGDAPASLELGERGVR